MHTIRRATIMDVTGISALVKDAFDETVNEEYAMGLIDRGKNMIWIAEDNGEIIGMISTFITIASRAIRRWEVDLMAVKTRYKGAGIAHQLLRRTAEDEREQKVNFTRGLVRVDNKAAQSAFRKAGYHSNEQVYSMLVWQPHPMQETSEEINSLVNIIPVETLTYRGIWLEGLSLPKLTHDERRAVIHHARAQAIRDNRHMVSTLYPAKKLTDDLLGNDYQVMGSYQWWRKP